MKCFNFLQCISFTALCSNMLTTTWQNRRWPLYDLLFSGTYLHRACLNSCAVMWYHQPTHFSKDEWGTYSCFIFKWIRQLDFKVQATTGSAGIKLYSWARVEIQIISLYIRYEKHFNLLTPSGNFMYGAV